MVLVSVRLRVAGETGKYSVAAGIRMTVAAGRPCPGMGPAVYREIGMHELGAAPSGCRMALGTVVRKYRRNMPRIGGGGVIG
jgi:hypothetical protein